MKYKFLKLNGFSTIWFAMAIRDSDVKGLITSIEAIEDRAKTAREYIKRLGLSNFVKIVTGNAKSILPNLNSKFDIVFII